MTLADRLLETRQRLDLDLAGVTVLTEAATGPYVVTPALAALAGAKVFAYTRETRHGTVKEVFAATRELLAACGFEQDDPQVRLIDQLTPEVVGAADVITNSGHLRPLDEGTMRHAKDGAVVPLMFEAWEVRDADIDLSYLRSRGILVGGTNERHPDIDVFGYLGEMAAMQVHQAGLSLHNNRFILVCNNPFGPFMARTLASVCERLAVIDLNENKTGYAGLDIDWIGGFPAFDIPKEYRGTAAVILAAYPFDQPWIAAHGPVHTRRLVEALDHPLVLQFAGDVNPADLAVSGIRHFPAGVPSGHMGILPSALGYDPIIRLQAGGLKAAQGLLTGSHLYRGEPIVELL